jgi:hypothetical protein
MHAAQQRLDDGEDSFSTPNEKRRRASAVQRYKLARRKAEKSLDAACDAMNELIRASEEVHPGVIRPYEDGRRRLVRDMAEFSCFLGDLNERGVE